MSTLSLQVLKYEDGQKYGEFSVLFNKCICAACMSFINGHPGVQMTPCVYGLQIRTLTTFSTRCGMMEQA